MVKKSSWTVRLGRTEWIRHTYDRPDEDSLRLLGSVRRGAQTGAFAITEQGLYVQVVGDHITELNKSQLSRAMMKAIAIEMQDPVVAPMRRPHRSDAPVAVTIKRRRVPVF